MRQSLGRLLKLAALLPVMQAATCTPDQLRFDVLAGLANYTVTSLSDAAGTILLNVLRL